MTTVALRCRCGQFQGEAVEVSPSTGSRVVCMCNDCQVYAHWLGCQEELLDEAGGTDIYQLTPSQLCITSGEEHLACVRLSPKGLLRWYTSCCKTPVANTLRNTQIPFAGLPFLIMDHQGKGSSRDADVGPVQSYILAKYATGKCPGNSHSKIPLSLGLRTVGRLLMGRLRGKHRPSPFFNSSGSPVVEPLVISKEKRNALEQASIS